MRPHRITRRRMVAVGTVIGVALATGWAVAPKTVPVGQLGPPNRVVVYAGGTPVIDRPVALGSHEEQAVTAWLLSHPSGWRYDLNSYAPVTYIKGEAFTLDVRRNLCVLNYRPSPNAKAAIPVSRTIKEDDEIRAVFPFPPKPK